MIFIGITTYGPPRDIIAQIENIYLRENEYWIHYNKREKKKDIKKLKEYFAKYKNVKIFSKYKVYWGNYSILKSCIHMQKQFLKSNKEIFIHLDAKTCNVISPEELNYYLIEKNNKKYNFMGSAQRNIEKMYEKTNKENISYPTQPNWCYVRNWYFRSTFNNNKYYRLYIFLLICRKLFSKPKAFLYLIKIILKKILKKNYSLDLFNLINSFFYKCGMNLFFNKKKYFIPKKLKKVNFIFSTKGGGGTL